MVAWNPVANELFLRALDLPTPVDRRVFLVRECADPDLRAQVESLLDAGERAGRFLSHPADPFAVTRDAESEQGAATLIDTGCDTGRVIAGRYHLLRQLGEGGMGTVWLADQTEPVRRQVALKLVRPGMDTARVVARFEVERQALALMDHPNVARVLDGGKTDRGRPFFVMELVVGMSLTQYCDEHRLTVRERLELFVSVCEAVQHAHQKGVMHRDLKPSNVMVTEHDGRPVPKVIDFGLAKALQAGTIPDLSAMDTTFGSVVGTPLYMAPEQAVVGASDVDTRADVYALGVILYELLTGTPPLGREVIHGSPLQDVLRAVREEDPPTPVQRLLTSKTLPTIAAARGTEPGRLTREVGGDLERIVLRCLEKDRSRRYETANALSRDVQRFLADEPVEACLPSVRYKLQKFVMRNKGRVIAGSLILLALVAGVIGTTLGLVRAESERRRAAAAEADALEQARAVGEERDRAEKLRGQAEANYHKARAAVDEYFTLISESKLLDVPGLQPLRKELLDAALRFYQGRVVERADDPDALANLAVTYLRVAEVCHTVNRNDEGVATIDQALTHIDRLVRDFPDARDSHGRLAGFWKGWRQRAGRSDPPRDPQAAFRTLNRLTTTWQEFGRRYPGVVGFRSDQAAIDTHIGDLLASMSQDKLAAPYLKRARAIQEQLVRDHPSLVECQADLALTYYILAQSQGRMGQVADQEATARAALALREQLAARSPTVPKQRSDLAASLIQVARCIAQQRPRDAEVYLRRAMELAQGLYREFPGSGLYVEQRAEAGRILATVLDAVGKPAEAERTYRSVAEALERHVAANPGNRQAQDGLAVFYRRRAEFLTKQPGRLHDAEQLHRQSLAIFEQLGDGSPVGLRYVERQGHTHRFIGWIQQVSGRPSEAELSFRRAMVIFERLIKDEPQNPAHRSLLADTQLHLGLQLQGQHRYAEAEPLLRGRAAYWKQQAGAESTEYAARLAELALNLLDQNKPAEADAVLLECLAVCEKKQPDSWLTFSVRSALGGARLGQKRYAEAEPLLLAGYGGMKQQADKAPAFGETRLPATAAWLVELYTALGKPGEAAKWRAERAKYPPEQAPPPRLVG